jgi:hypothetical protein
MKKTIALVVAGIVSGAAFATALTHHAAAAAPFSSPVLYYSATERDFIETAAAHGYTIRAVGACPIGPACVWLQK